ncbi:MAG TPA: type II toxin-antitoxin system RelE/ParE family toxin [Bosea sp. (in: a-proteobacteria)]
MQIEALPAFDRWLAGLRDREALRRIATRLFRLQRGNPGDGRFLRDGVSELKIDHGPGYRIYYAKRGDVLILLLGGGDKSTQAKDIEKAIGDLNGWNDARKS